MPSWNGSIRSRICASASLPISIPMRFRRHWPSTASHWRGLESKSENHDLGADFYAAVEIDHVGIAHADAAGRDVVADGPGLVRAVDAVERRAEIHRARAERIVRAAGHEMRQTGLALEHFLRRGPIRPFLHGGDRVRARPGEARAADADAVAHRLAVAL